MGWSCRGRGRGLRQRTEGSWACSSHRSCPCWTATLRRGRLWQPSVRPATVCLLAAQACKCEGCSGQKASALNLCFLHSCMPACCKLCLAFTGLQTDFLHALFAFRDALDNHPWLVWRQSTFQNLTNAHTPKCHITDSVHMCAHSSPWPRSKA
jgi:hypothetical protein